VTRILQAAATLLLALMLAAPASAVQKPPATCGGQGLPPGAGACRAGEFCEAPVGQCFVVAIGGGTCRRNLQQCVNIVRPVCGCDLRTYNNDCLRREAKVSKLHDGRC